MNCKNTVFLWFIILYKTKQVIYLNNLLSLWKFGVRLGVSASSRHTQFARCRQTQIY